MAPIIRRLMESDWAKPYVIAVGQHTHLLDLAIKDFDIGIDERIEIARSRSSIAELLARVVDSLDSQTGIDQCGLHYRAGRYDDGSVRWTGRLPSPCFFRACRSRLTDGQYGRAVPGRI